MSEEKVRGEKEKSEIMENLFSFSRKNNKDREREREKRMVPEEKAVQLFNREREKGF